MYDGAAFNAVTRSVRWPGCYEFYTLQETNRLSEATALQTARCTVSLAKDSYFIYPASFFKLRDLSLTMPVSQRFIRRASSAQFTLAGHNVWKWVNKVTFTHPALTRTLQHYTDMVLHLDRQIEALDADIEDIASRAPFREMVAKLSCLRGISTLAAMVILSEVYDLRRFATASEFMAFLGIVPSEHSSGEKQRRGGITKTGNGRVRRILVEAAWAYRHYPKVTSRQRKMFAQQPPAVADVCSKANLRLTRRFRRLEARGKKSPVALTAIARELAGFVWAVARTGT